MKNFLRLVTVLFVFVAVFASFLFFSPLNVAKGVGMNTFYGGKIKKVTYCTCYYNPAVVLEVEDLASNQTKKVIYSPYMSRLRADYNIWTSGGCVIGGYMQASLKCEDTSGYYCRQNSNAGNLDGAIDMLRGIGSTQQSNCNTKGGGNSGGGSTAK